MDHLYKSQLQTYALKQNLDLPVYATEREGPPHAPRFRCKVTFCGQTFQSHEFFPTLKSAEHAAAKIALTSLTPQSPEASSYSFWTTNSVLFNIVFIFFSFLLFRELMLPTRTCYKKLLRKKILCYQFMELLHLARHIRLPLFQLWSLLGRFSEEKRQKPKSWLR